MFVLDTNVISALMGPRADPVVDGWLDSVDRQSVWTTAITQAEVMDGIGQLPDGRRRAFLTERATIMFESLYKGRILPFDSEAAKAYGRIMEQQRRVGRPVATLDSQIAAICLSQDMTVVTRNARDFEASGLIDVLNPWDQG